MEGQNDKKKRTFEEAQADGLQSYTMTQTTLEDVFLGVAAGKPTGAGGA